MYNPYNEAYENIQSKNFEFAIQKTEKIYTIEKLTSTCLCCYAIMQKSLRSIFESIFIATCSLTCYLKIDKCNCNVARTGSNHYLKKVHVLFVSINGSHKTKDITIITLAINVQHWKVCSNFNAYSNLLHELCKNLCVLFSRSQYRNYMRHNSY